MTQPHHLSNITSHGGETREMRAARLVLADKSIPEIAEELFGVDDGFTRSATWTLTQSSEVRKLIEQGRAKALGAH